MPRSVLKPHATLFATILRICDPALSLVVGVVAYRAYLGSFTLPEHYLLFMGAGALAVAAVFPLLRLYEPQRGAGLGEEVRRLLFAWLLLAALTGGTIFATKTGDGFSRVWVSAWLLGGFAATAALRLTVRALLRALRLSGRNLRHVRSSATPAPDRRAAVGVAVAGLRDRRVLRRRPGARRRGDRRPAGARARRAPSGPTLRRRRPGGSRCRCAPRRASARS